MCVNFEDEILLRGKNVKPKKIRNFQKWKNGNNNNNKLS